MFGHFWIIYIKGLSETCLLDTAWELMLIDEQLLIWELQISHVTKVLASSIVSFYWEQSPVQVKVTARSCWCGYHYYTKQRQNLGFCVHVNSAFGRWEICDGENFWHWSWLKIRFCAFSSIKHSMKSIHHHKLTPVPTIAIHAFKKSSAFDGIMHHVFLFSSRCFRVVFG